MAIKDAHAEFSLSIAWRSDSAPLIKASVPNADLAAYLAGEAVSSLRHHEVDAPSLADVLIQRAREVRFTVDRTEAVTLLAATIREQRLEGILEGLRLAGLLSEPSKDRHSGITS
ncbi:hypothetical protein LUI11_37025 [Bradyrhizobium diazoefficiens]|uniref:hypothetical protein n=1 Tax=Bradyrhizobium TaxID=374 RepID=UPI000676385E|nr:hypothetical protein [Bradyrhizobium diazoefficiens]APO55346.1 hypothetical protein BD122_33715 [Bradyrhizobium diazoefficiens]MCD9298008.1 hypothetical protein [Bradyrhizobium diazoefficiens]MCD9815527.1 hypothetical protein [Bradyrhizobium diazoefficiens]MCD9833455.1 hypothetical protein [Bradyrhizobium diazoefficiens]MCD9852123.1 hypothetical protein [Bradyrhizobium diazoefficiens]